MTPLEIRSAQGAAEHCHVLLATLPGVSLQQ